ncbi:MAG: dihydroorotate dehydrogenase, partial [candidate division NC10 bacterium]|nr:dihydroorotate dehydrogenase [candidate division NC10 bacterium]
MRKPSLTVELAGLRLKNPVMTASGTCGYAEELAPYADLSGLGAVVVKTITLQPRVGNPAPRIAETPSGMLNSIGLQNVGIEAFLREKLPVLRRLKVPILVNIAGKSVEEYAELAKRLEGVPGVSALELNISCPNVAGGLDYGTD